MISNGALHHELASTSVQPEAQAHLSLQAPRSPQQSCILKWQAGMPENEIESFAPDVTGLSRHQERPDLRLLERLSEESMPAVQRPLGHLQECRPMRANRWCANQMDAGRLANRKT